MFPGFTLSLALWTMFAPHLDYCCLPGLSLFALPLLDIVRRSSTHACPKDYSVSCPCHTCLLFIDPACIMTMFWNKALHMDPHVSRLVRPVTIITSSIVIKKQQRTYNASLWCCIIHQKSLLNMFFPFSPLLSIHTKIPSPI